MASSAANRYPLGDSMTRNAGATRQSPLSVLLAALVLVPTASPRAAKPPRLVRTIVQDEPVARGRDSMEPCEGPAPVCALLSRFVSAFNARDFEAFRQTFADDISFFVDRPFPPARLDGRAAAERVFAAGFAPYAPRAREPKPPLPPPLIPSHLRVQAFGDVAIITFEVSRPSEVARRTLVAQLQGSDWRIVHIHASSADIAP